MRSLSLGAKQPNRPATSKFNRLHTISVISNRRQKIKTLSRYESHKCSVKKNKLDLSTKVVSQNSINLNIQNSIMGFAMNLIQNSPIKKNNFFAEQPDGVKVQRRDRLKKSKNPFMIINHYLKNQGFVPRFEQIFLIDRLVQFKDFFNDIRRFSLQQVLKEIYKFFNMAVDLNQTKFLLLLIMMAAQICYEAEQFNSAFYFYHQACIAATCLECWSIKVQALIYLGRICLRVLQCTKSILFFKKALQYAWKIQDSETQLRIYDLIGESYSNQGKVQQSLYYHNRYILGENAKNQSAVKRTSHELLKQYLNSLDYSQRQNLSLLFIGYLRLPINNFSIYPPFSTKIYSNYINNESPRKYCGNLDLSLSQFSDVNYQIDKVLKEQQFKTQIPNPDLYSNYIVTNKYGKIKKQVDFLESNQYHKVMGIKRKENYKVNLKPPIEQVFNKILKQKPNAHWWEDILIKSKKQRSQKISSIRNKLLKTHLSFHKFPQQKRKIQEQKFERVGQCVNKIILNYIDPPKI